MRTCTRQACDTSGLLNYWKILKAQPPLLRAAGPVSYNQVDDSGARAASRVTIVTPVPVNHDQLPHRCYPTTKIVQFLACLKQFLTFPCCKVPAGQDTAYASAAATCSPADQSNPETETRACHQYLQAHSDRWALAADKSAGGAAAPAVVAVAQASQLTLH